MIFNSLFSEKRRGLEFCCKHKEFEVVTVYVINSSDDLGAGTNYINIRKGAYKIIVYSED